VKAAYNERFATKVEVATGNFWQVMVAGAGGWSQSLAVTVVIKINQLVNLFVQKCQ